jgi:hypothetical protein
MVNEPGKPNERERRQFYRTIKGPRPTHDDFLSDAGAGFPPPRNPDRVRYWQGFSVFDTLEQARAVAQRNRKQGDFIAEMTILVTGPIRYERWGKNPGHHTLWGDPDECLARVTKIFPVFPHDEVSTDDDAL